MTSSIEIGGLATEFGVSEDVMAAFVDRFCPADVKPGTFAEESDVVLFVHIPKTAGISVGRSLRGAFDDFFEVRWDQIPKSFRRASRKACYNGTFLGRRQIIMGHFGWPELKTWIADELPLKCATILRSPVDRVISNYNYNRSEAHPANVEFTRAYPTCHDYVAQIPRDYQLTRMIGPVLSFEQVLTKLIAYYSFVGLTEELGRSLTHLSSSHGLPELAEHRTNVGAPVTEPPDEALVQAIIDRSHNDLLIHRLMTKLYAA